MPLPFTHAYVPVRSSEEADHNSNVDASPRSRPFLHSLTTAVALLVLTTSAIFLLAVWRLQLSLPSIGEVSKFIARVTHSDTAAATGTVDVSVDWDLPLEKSNALHDSDIPFDDRSMIAPAVIDSLFAQAYEQLPPRNAADTNISFSEKLAAVRTLTVLFEVGGHGCSGFFIEAANLIYSLSLYLYHDNLYVILPPWRCNGMPSYIEHTLSELARKDVNDRVMDVWISHQTPNNWPRQWPYEAWHQRVFRAPRALIGRAMVETHRAPRQWAELINHPRITRVWLTSRQQAAPFILAGADASKLSFVPEPIDTVLYHRNVSARASDTADSHCQFHFLSVFKLEERKGWKELLLAFFNEFRDDEGVCVVLHSYLYRGTDQRNALKLRALMRSFVESSISDGRIAVKNASQLPWSRVHLRTNELPTNQIPSLYAAMDAYVSATHGEGWGLPMAESMFVGLPVIAPHAIGSGFLEFVNANNSFTVPLHHWQAVQGDDFETGTLWSVPSVRSLRHAMRFVVENPAVAKAKAARAHSEVTVSLSIDAVARTMIHQLLDVYQHLRRESSHRNSSDSSQWT